MQVTGDPAADLRVLPACGDGTPRVILAAQRKIDFKDAGRRGQVLEEAVREAQSIDREKVRAALFRLDTMTIIGRFGVDSTGKQVRQHTFIIQWQEGKKELVWPEEIQTTELFK